MIKNILYIDLFSGETTILPPSEFADAIRDCNKVETATHITYEGGGNYLVVVTK
jgi:hypothetical protein